MYAELSTDYCRIDEETGLRVASTQGAFFTPLCRLSPEKIAADLLNPVKALAQAELLSRYVPLQGRTVLEIGSGLGVNLISWTRKYSVNMTGIEPEGCGFDSSLPISRELLAANGIPADKVVAGRGEVLPFSDESYDIVYSTNVLEHVEHPGRVLREGLRVLKKGGTLQYVFPNYRSFFDGHYAVFHPPVLWRSFFPWYVKHVCHRDPAYAHTLRTELCVSWTHRQLKSLKNEYSFEVGSLGEDLFVERMQSGRFNPWAGLSRVKRVVDLATTLRLNAMAARLLAACRVWTPIILTLRKK